MPFDFKKEYREFYLPGTKPGIVTVPPMRFIAVRGRGDPNRRDGEYQRAVSLLYGIAYTVRMSGRTKRRIEGYFDFVVPPLEGFWRQEGAAEIDLARKEDLLWISAIRVPDFVTGDDFRWAAEECGRKKGTDPSGAELLEYEEGLCVQCMHIGPYDAEPASVERMHEYARLQGFIPELSPRRQHHEIYLNSPGRTAPERLKTVIRHPVRRA